MQKLRWEFSIGKALARIALGMIVFIEALIALDFVVYIGSVGLDFNQEVVAAYDGDYDRAYVQTYDSGYQDAYSEAYVRGYEKGYEIGMGMGSGSVGEVATLVELHNPTYEEVMEFLARDDTDSRHYIKGAYVCRDFAADVNNNAESEGIRTAYVRIRTERWSHVIVAFETVDMGLIFIEPMSDAMVSPELGEAYCWMAKGGRIVEVQIIW
jgi:hypothetical protein